MSTPGGFSLPRRGALAAIANVSKPPVSRLESGNSNIQGSSVLAILSVLGMVEKL